MKTDKYKTKMIITTNGKVIAYDCSCKVGKLNGGKLIDIYYITLIIIFLSITNRFTNYRTNIRTI